MAPAATPDLRALEASVALDDGRRLLVRPVRPEDEAAFHAAFAKLSPASIRQRFFATMTELPLDLAARLTRIDYDRDMALVAIDPVPGGTPEIYGVVRLSTGPGDKRAEYALIVRDDMAGHGLGTQLMRRIIDYAKARGLDEIYGYVLAENHGMLQICREFGFRVTTVAGDPGVVRVFLELQSDPTRPSTAQDRRGRP